MSTSAGGNRKLVGVLVGLLVAAGGLYGSIVLSRGQPSTAPPAPAVAQRPVVVAARAIAQGTVIGKEDVVVKSLPISAVSEEAAGTAQAVVGNYAAIAIPVGTAIGPSILTQSAPGLSPPKAALLPVKDGYVAIAIPNDAQKGVGNWVQPGDHIDILVDLGGGTAKYAFQDVPVLKTSSASGAIAPAPSPSPSGAAAAPGGAAAPSAGGDLLIVELPRRDAQALSAVLSGSAIVYGKTPATILRYALRPTGSYDKGALDSGVNSKPANDPPLGPNELGGLFNH